ncbi:MAG: TonB-dependent receptor [Candidatus Oleimicrobiaceae bacterium]
MRPGTISLAKMATFAGLMVALGYMLSGVPNVELVTATAFVAGVVLGWRKGLLTAMAGELLYAAINPYGISSFTLLAAQVLGMGLAGLLGGLVGRGLLGKKRGAAHALLLATCGLCLTVMFDFLTTVGFLIMSGLTLPALLGAYAYGAAFYLTHPAVNTAVFALLVPAALGVLVRKETSEKPKTREVEMEKSKQFFLAILCLACISTGARAQVAGVVVDKTNGKPLGGANVTVAPGPLGAATDDDGHFVIRPLPPGTYEIRVSYIGYEPQLLRVRLTEKGAQELYVELVPEVIELEEVMVTAKRGRSLSWELPVSAEVISAADIAMANATTVGEALRPAAGVFVKSYGSEAGMRSLSVRGSSAEQVLVLWDGARINSPLAGGCDLGLLPLAAVERIELVRSGLSSLYGADAAAGVVNIITRAPKGGGHPQASMATGIGSLGGRHVQLVAGHELGEVGVVLAASRARSDGEFSYRTTDPATGRQRKEKRINNSFAMDELFAKVSWHSTSSTQVTASGELSHADRGAPGSLAFPSPLARQTDESRRAQLVLLKRVGGALSLQATGFHHELNTTYVDPNPMWPSEAHNTGISSGASLQGDLPLGQSKVLSVGGSYLRERSRGTSLGAHTRQALGAFAQADLTWRKLWGLRSLQASVLPALRLDRYEGFGSVRSPKVGLVLSHVGTTHASIRGNVGRSFRAPTFNDLYWPADAFTVGNPALKPERITEVEGGLSLSLPAAGRLHSDVSWYRRWAHELIVWGMDLSTYKWSPANVSEALISGQEVRLKWEAPGQLAVVEVSYSHLQARNKGDVPGVQGKQLIYRPEHSASFRAGLDKRWWYCNAVASYVGARYTDEANTKQLPAHAVVDGNVGVRMPLWGVTWHIRLSLDNLFDADYQVVDGYPMPGRLWKATLGVTL